MIVKYFFCLAAMSIRSIGTKPHLEPTYVADVATLMKQSTRYFLDSRGTRSGRITPVAAKYLHPPPRRTRRTTTYPFPHPPVF